MPSGTAMRRNHFSSPSKASSCPSVILPKDTSAPRGISIIMDCIILSVPSPMFWDICASCISWESSALCRRPFSTSLPFAVAARSPMVEKRVYSMGISSADSTSALPDRRISAADAPTRIP